MSARNDEKEKQWCTTGRFCNRSAFLPAIRMALVASLLMKAQTGEAAAGSGVPFSVPAVKHICDASQDFKLTTAHARHELAQKGATISGLSKLLKAIEIWSPNNTAQRRTAALGRQFILEIQTTALQKYKQLAEEATHASGSAGLAAGRIDETIAVLADLTTATTYTGSDVACLASNAANGGSGSKDGGQRRQDVSGKGKELNGCFTTIIRTEAPPTAAPKPKAKLVGKPNGDSFLLASAAAGNCPLTTVTASKVVDTTNGPADLKLADGLITLTSTGGGSNHAQSKISPGSDASAENMATYHEAFGAAETYQTTATALQQLLSSYLQSFEANQNSEELKRSLIAVGAAAEMTTPIPKTFESTYKEFAAARDNWTLIAEGEDLEAKYNEALRVHLKAQNAMEDRLKKLEAGPKVIPKPMEEICADIKEKAPCNENPNCKYNDEKKEEPKCELSDNGKKEAEKAKENQEKKDECKNKQQKDCTGNCKWEGAECKDSSFLVHKKFTLSAAAFAALLF
uniref:Variant surface glycoprotein n=1 Tax=Trypanosoma brucei TaxID=5691 RepID=S5G3W9_9TRYP|nr:variant surface glycoprotein [Trypanosoma brucei]